MSHYLTRYRRIVKVKVIVAQPQSMLVKLAKKEAVVCAGAVFSLLLMGLIAIALITTSVNSPMMAVSIVLHSLAGALIAGVLIAGVLRQ